MTSHGTVSGCAATRAASCKCWQAGVTPSPHIEHRQRLDWKCPVGFALGGLECILGRKPTPLMHRVDVGSGDASLALNTAQGSGDDMDRAL